MAIVSVICFKYLRRSRRWNKRNTFVSSDLIYISAVGFWLDGCICCKLHKSRQRKQCSVSMLMLKQSNVTTSISSLLELWCNKIVTNVVTKRTFLFIKTCDVQQISYLTRHLNNDRSRLFFLAINNNLNNSDGKWFGINISALSLISKWTTFHMALG